MVRLLFMVACITSLLSWGVLGFVDLYIVAAISLASIVIAGGIGYITSSSNGTMYGIFKDEDKNGFSIAQLKPTEKVSAEDRSFAIHQIIDAGGIPVDPLGHWLCMHGMFSLGLRFSIKPGPMTEEYLKMRLAEAKGDKAGENNLKAGVKEAQSHLPDKED